MWTKAGELSSIPAKPPGRPNEQVRLRCIKAGSYYSHSYSNASRQLLLFWQGWFPRNDSDVLSHCQCWATWGFCIQVEATIDRCEDMKKTKSDLWFVLSFLQVVWCKWGWLHRVSGIHAGRIIPILVLASVINYGPLTEPKFYIAKSGRTQISTSNDHISETKQDFFRSAGAKIGQ